MVDLVIKNARVITPAGMIYGGVAVSDGVIVYVGSNYGLPRGKRVLDARGDFIIPGLIDAHVHIAPSTFPSLEEALRATFKPETDGALHGGVTMMGHYLSSPKGKSLLPGLETTVGVGQELSYIDFFLHAMIVDEGHIADEPALCRKGVTSFKHMFNPYKGAEATGNLGPCDEGMLFRSFESIAGWGYPALGMCHCEEMDIISILADRLRQAGRTDLLAWTEARPNLVEYMRIAHAINIARAVGCPLYIVHISTAEGIELVAEEQRRGYPVYGETCPQYLTLTGDMEAQIGCWGKMTPPLKYRKDNEALWRHIRTGVVTSIGTDVTPTTLEEKEKGGGKHNNIWNARPSVCGGMEHMLPVMMTCGVNAGRISMEDLVRVCSTDTARVFGLYPKKGCLSPGSDADIVIVDPDREAVINRYFYHCQADYSTYEGWKVRGMARTTIVRGEVMMEDYATVGKPGWGRYVPRGRR